MGSDPGIRTDLASRPVNEVHFIANFRHWWWISLALCRIYKLPMNCTPSN